MSNDLRKILILLAIGLLIALLILILFFFFGGDDAPSTQTPVLTTPQGERVVSEPRVETPTQFVRIPATDAAGFSTPFVFTYPPIQSPSTGYTPPQTSSPGSAPTEPETPSDTTPSTATSSASSPTGSGTTRPRTPAVINYDGVTTPAPAVVWPSRGDGVVRGGGNPGGGGRPDYEFDPITGNARIGDYYFAFAMETVGDLSTTNYAGDPDNLVFGQALGIFIGSLVGLPDIGLNIGTAIGSNLFPGYRLSDFGISIQNGIPSFGGISANGVVEAFGGDLGGLGIGGGQTQYFGGFAMGIPCTCGENYWWLVTTPSQYMGTYLYKPGDSKLYDHNSFFGPFWALGSYENSSSANECKMYIVEDCVDIEITKGTLNDQPGTGTSGLGI